MAESRSATHSMLKATQKYFTKLSKYLNMKDSKRPHMASVAVACANTLSPLNRFRSDNDALSAMESILMPS